MIPSVRVSGVVGDSGLGAGRCAGQTGLEAQAVGCAAVAVTVESRIPNPGFRQGSAHG